MRTIASSPRTHTTPDTRRVSRLGALCFGVVVGALTAIIGGVLLWLLGLSRGTRLVAPQDGHRMS